MYVVVCDDFIALKPHDAPVCGTIYYESVGHFILLLEYWTAIMVVRVHVCKLLTMIKLNIQVLAEFELPLCAVSAPPFRHRRCGAFVVDSDAWLLILINYCLCSLVEYDLARV